MSNGCMAPYITVFFGIITFFYIYRVYVIFFIIFVCPNGQAKLSYNLLNQIKKTMKKPNQKQVSNESFYVNHELRDVVYSGDSSQLTTQEADELVFCSPLTRYNSVCITIYSDDIESALSECVSFLKPLVSLVCVNHYGLHNCLLNVVSDKQICCLINLISHCDRVLRTKALGELYF